MKLPATPALVVTLVLAVGSLVASAGSPRAQPGSSRYFNPLMM
jgi:hypothetical protein